MPGRAEQGRVAVIIENALYPKISSSISQYQYDLSIKGYGSIVSLVDGGTPDNLRAYLIGLYNGVDGLAGAVFVGNVPYVIYELMQDWDGSGGDPPEYEDFPCDLFFMDMDGAWYDKGAGGTVGASNGKYDEWDDPDHEIEIWAGRMQVETLPQLGYPEDILNNYFLKNHLYRTGKMPTQADPAQGLIYVDDDWGTMVGDYHGDAWCVEQVYGAGNVTSVFDLDSNPGNNATAADYKTNHLPLNYQLVLLRSHGYPGGHGFYQDYRNTFAWAMSADYLSIDPPALFYSMFVCSGCDYTAQYGTYASYVGGTAAFNEDYGLFSWGSAKTGGMWNDEAFYSVLAEPNAFGPAFVNWFNVSHALYAEYAPRWWYGMVLIGDPALIPNGDYDDPTAVASADRSEPSVVLGNHPNPFNPSTEIHFSIDRNAFVTLRIFDVHGRCIRTLVRETMDRGSHSVIWDGTDNRGAPAGSGVYLARLEDDGPARTHKMLLLK